MVSTSRINRVANILTVIVVICIFASAFYMSWRMMDAGPDGIEDTFRTFQTMFMIIFILVAALILMNVLRAFLSHRNVATSYTPNEYPYQHDIPQKCRNCGIDIANDPAYCPECGFRLKDDFYHR